MKRLCKTVEQYLVSDWESLPESLQAHVQACPRCRAAWQLARAYRKTVQMVRDEPVPVSTTAWAQVRAKLSARATACARPVWWRFAPAFALGLVAFVAFSLTLVGRVPHKPAEVAHAGEPGHLLEYRLEVPPRDSQGSGPRRTAPLTAAEPMPPSPAEGLSTRPAESLEVALRALKHRGSNGNTRRRTKSVPTTVQLAQLPETELVVEVPALSDFEIPHQSEVSYLPIQYGTPSGQPYSEGNGYAIVGSF